MAYESEESLKIYLWEISKTPLLTIEQENVLAERIKNGDPEARSLMICANLRLVVKIAQDYASYGVPVSDLISEGNMGLMKAVERFDPTKWGKLSTYAVWWIKQSIKRALANQWKTIRLPVHMVDKIAKMRRISNMLTEVLWHEPTDEELAEETGVSRKTIATLFRASQRPVSLDAPVKEGEPTEYSEIISDERAENPLDMISNKNLHGELDDLLSVLDERERRVIEKRFGLNGQEVMTLEEVGHEFGVTRERIRQLQNTALKKMRRALRKKEKFGSKLWSWKQATSREPKELTEDATKIRTLVSSTQIRLKKGLMTPSEEEPKTAAYSRIRIPAIDITDDKEYNRYREILLNHAEVKVLIDERGHKSRITFLEKMKNIKIEWESSSAAEILKGVLMYAFVSGKFQMPWKIQKGKLMPKNIKVANMIHILRNIAA